MEQVNFSYLIGAERGGIRWGRPTIFFAALFLADFLTWLFFTIFKTYIEQKKDNTLNMSYSFLPNPPNPLYFASENIIKNLILAILLVLIFYLIKNELIATIVAVVSYTLFALVTTLITDRINLYNLTGTFFYSPGYEREFPWMLMLLGSAVYVFFVIGGMVLAAYLIKLTWLALPIGALVGSIAYRLSLEGINFLYLDKYEFKPKDAIPFLISSVILGFVFWLGIWITADKPPLPEGEKPRLSKEFYAGTWASTILVGCISLVVVILSMTDGSPRKDNVISAAILLLVALVLIIYGAVVFMILIYKMWAAIQDGYARTTPGQAVGYLFIPIYSLYWMFQVLPGFAKDYNDYTARYNLNIRPLSTGIFTAYCALVLLSLLPFVSILFGIANYFVGIAVMCKACDAVNALPATFERPQQPQFMQYS